MNTTMNTNEIKIELSIDEIKKLMRKARAKVDNNYAYVPGTRREEIWGWFWAYLDKRLGRELSLKEFYAYSNQPGVEELVFRG